MEPEGEPCVGPGQQRFPSYSHRSHRDIFTPNLRPVGLCLLDSLWSQVFGTRAAVLGPARWSVALCGRRPPAESRSVVRAKFDSSFGINRVLIIAIEAVIYSVNHGCICPRLLGRTMLPIVHDSLNFIQLNKTSVIEKVFGSISRGHQWQNTDHLKIQTIFRLDAQRLDSIQIPATNSAASNAKGPARC